MKGYQLKFYFHENQKHGGILLYEWLINKGKEIGIHGGSVFRAIAGFGRDGIIREEYFFELASNVSIEVVFILLEDKCADFLAFLEQEKLNIFFVKIPVEFGWLGK